MKNAEGVRKNSGDKQGVIFIIERACLELVQVGKSDYLIFSPKNKKFELLNGSKQNWKHVRWYGYNPSDYQPEIAHEAIKAVLD